LTTPAPIVAAAGWYADPWHRFQWRWWDGAGWTSFVATGQWSGTDSHYGPAPAAWPRTGQWDWPVTTAPADSKPELPKYPLRAGWLALAGIAGGTALSLVVGLLTWWITRSPATTDVIGQAGLWAGLIAAMVAVSRRYGTGRIARDFLLRAKWIDAPLGVLWAIVARFAAGFALIFVLQISHRFAGVNGEELRNARHNVAEMVVLFLIAVVGAPIIEEMFFRGFLLNTFRSRFNNTASVVLQGLCFGFVHVSPFRGFGNVAVFVSLTVFGIVQGAILLKYRRLGPGIASHVFTNLVATIVNFVS
jgi:membrane protease YdiL (CAAX protease family)